MFSSEQIFEISGSMDQLEMAIRFALDMSDTNQSDITYQITEGRDWTFGRIEGCKDRLKIWLL